MLIVKKTPSPRSKVVHVSAEAYALVVANSTLEDTFESALDRLLKITTAGDAPAAPAAGGGGDDGSGKPPDVPKAVLAFPSASHTASGTTRQEVMEGPILEGLKALGGKTTTNALYEHLEPLLPLTAQDYQVDGKGRVHWRTKAGWAISVLRQSGKVKKAIHNGVVELA